MNSSIIIIMPDQLDDPIRVISRGPDGRQVENYARLQQIRTGEYAHDLPSARRYEISSESSEHASDIVERRFIIDDHNTTTTPGGGTLPAWSLKSTTLHPDRHDIAAWFQQANEAPRPVWAAHIPVIVRDALRNRQPAADDETAIMVLPDRAALIASRDNENHPLASVMDTFAAKVHVIDQHCHRSGEILAPINFADGGNDQSYAAVVTRAQAVIAEAIVSSHEAQPIPKADEFIARWESIINGDLVGSMKREDDNTFASPMAIIDDHQAKDRATIILATLRIKLGTVRPDIWLSYHTVYDLVIGRGGSVNYENDLRADEGPRQSDKREVLTALNEGRLPILNLSADRSGKFKVRDCETDVPGAIPLLRDQPLFTLSQAALAMTLFRRSAAHKVESEVSWSDVFGIGKTDGETNKQGAVTEKKVAEQNQPSEPDKTAPETGHEDRTENNVLGTNHGSETDQATMMDAAEFGKGHKPFVPNLKEITDTLTDADQMIIDMIRNTVTAKRRSHPGMMEIPSRDQIDNNLLTYDKIVFRFSSKQLTSTAPKSRKLITLARKIWEHPARWPRFLLVINILPELHNTKRGRANSSFQDIARAALATVRQCKLNETTDLKLNVDATQAPSNTVSGGPNG